MGKKGGPVKENQAAARTWPIQSWSQFMVFTGSLCKMLACSEVKLKDLLRNLNKITEWFLRCTGQLAVEKLNPESPGL